MLNFSSDSARFFASAFSRPYLVRPRWAWSCVKRNPWASPCQNAISWQCCLSSPRCWQFCLWKVFLYLIFAATLRLMVEQPETVFDCNISWSITILHYHVAIQTFTILYNIIKYSTMSTTNLHMKFQSFHVAMHVEVNIVVNHSFPQNIAQHIQTQSWHCSIVLQCVQRLNVYKHWSQYINARRLGLQANSIPSWISYANILHFKPIYANLKSDI